ncbi:MAG: potassium-transporting ATPase subunit KdpA [Planctomycetota bacterium]
MTANGMLQILMYLLTLSVLACPLGLYMARIYEGRPPRWAGFLSPLEAMIYRLCGIRADQEMSWKTYAIAILIFNAAGMFAVYALQRLQGFLPLNPQDLGAVPPDSAFNTAASFATNTNWQAYSGEATMSYLTQMLGLSVQNFLSAATGMAVLLPLTRGFVRKTTDNLGNFWVDLTRSILYILLPLSFTLAVLLVSQGVVQTLTNYPRMPLVQETGHDKPVFDPDGKPVLDALGRPKTENITVKDQEIAIGPVASQIAIKQLGTNGGGFFNVNSAHPFENPTPFSNWLEMLAILLIPAAFCHTFGEMVRDVRQGWALFAAMFLVLAGFAFGCYWAESSGNPRLANLHLDQRPREARQETPPSFMLRWGPISEPGVDPRAQSGGNMEGKEVRFGTVNSALWATATTAASNGSVNAMHDSFTPLGGLFPLVLIQFGEVIFGGVGSGLYGMLAFVIVAVFVAGLMVGRTPEYLGKKIETYEVKMAASILLIPHAIILAPTAIAVLTGAGTSGVANPGPHGLSEILYAFSSMGNNNGSAFAGLSANTPFYNILGGVVMLIARYGLAIPTLAIAGSLARKKPVPVSAGTLPTHTPLFVGLLIMIIVLVGVLTFLPALALGPIAEHLQMTP